MANWIGRFLEAIAVHKSNASSHHTRYTDAEAVAAVKAAGFSKVIWKDVSEGILSDADRTETLTWTALDITAETSPNAKFAILVLRLKADTVGSGNNSGLMVREGGVAVAQYPELRLGLEATEATLYPLVVIVGLSDARVVEYRISVGTGWQVDSYIYVLGYIE